MKIILTKSFIKDFEKDFKNYNLTYQDLVFKLKTTKIINLVNPFIKFKITIKWISLRWIGIINDNNKTIPIFFVLKKDKKYWENLVLNKEILQKINNKFTVYSKDFDSWDIIEF